MTIRDRSLEYRCTTCGAAPREECEGHHGWARFESHPKRVEAMHLREFFRKRVVLPTLAIGSLEISIAAPQRIEMRRVEMVIDFPDRRQAAISS